MLSRVNKARTNYRFFNRTEVIKFQAERIAFEYISYSYLRSSCHILFNNINVFLIYTFMSFPLGKKIV